MPKKHKLATPKALPQREENVVDVTEITLRINRAGRIQMSVMARVGDESDPENYVAIRKVRAAADNSGDGLDDYILKNASNQSTIFDNILKAAYALLVDSNEIDAGTLE
jgi:hypothetical protein